MAFYEKNTYSRAKKPWSLRFQDTIFKENIQNKLNYAIAVYRTHRLNRQPVWHRSEVFVPIMHCAQKSTSCFFRCRHCPPNRRFAPEKLFWSMTFVNRAGNWSVRQKTLPNPKLLATFSRGSTWIRTQTVVIERQRAVSGNALIFMLLVANFANTK